MGLADLIVSDIVEEQGIFSISSLRNKYKDLLHEHSVESVPRSSRSRLKRRLVLPVTNWSFGIRDDASKVN